MKSESRALLTIRHAVREHLASLPLGSKVGIAVSGGADSMALALACHVESKEHSHQLLAIIIDHGLQSGSDEVARKTEERLREIGVTDLRVIKVDVELTDGIESSARRARYAALEQCAREEGLTAIFLGHTKNDQAETVLLGLARGSGARSLSGMSDRKGIYIRPLLYVERAITIQACEESGIEYWSDPHNDDPKFLRVRARRLIPTMESEIGPGIVDALARSADLLRDDADALDGYARDFFATIDPTDIEVETLQRLSRAVRTRVLRLAIYQLGAPSGSLTSDHLAPVEALVTEWHGQGPTSLPGGVKVERKSGRLSLSRRG